jgi:adenine-specific DNA-methyltransferase
MPKKQKLELTWIGKDEESRLEPRILIEDPEKSYGDKNSENMLIHGDNLLALKALEQDFSGKIKCIYIDPPYNTGAAFDQYDDGLEHSIWLSLIRSRLELLWKLLDPLEGSIWISIDDREVAYLRVLADELFGRSQFLACNVWQKRYSRENREAIGDVHEYILVYVKNKQIFKENRNKVSLTQQQAKVYRNPNNDPKGPWRTIPLTAQAGHATPEQFYEIISPGGKVHTPPEGRCWGLAQKTFKKLREEGKIYFGKNGDSQPNLIRYLSEVDGVVPWTWWPSDEVGHTDESKKEQHAIFGKENAFDTPKPERLIERIIHIASTPGDIILDSFIGSGTTVAVAHKMNRRWIGIELGNHCYTHCLPRQKKVCDGIDQGGISKTVDWKGGGGFRFYELAPSLLRKDKYDNWVVDERYNADMLAYAMAKHEGFKYKPSEDIYWKQGQSTEKDFIFTTTRMMTGAFLNKIHEDMREDESLLICCKSYQKVCENKYPNITIRKIPHTLLGRCEFGKEDYSLNVINMPHDEDEPDFVPVGPQEEKIAKGKKMNKNNIQKTLF